MENNIYYQKLIAFLHQEECHMYFKINQNTIKENEVLFNELNNAINNLILNKKDKYLTPSFFYYLATRWDYGINNYIKGITKTLNNLNSKNKSLVILELYNYYAYLYLTIIEKNYYFTARNDLLEIMGDDNKTLKDLEYIRDLTKDHIDNKELNYRYRYVFEQILLTILSYCNYKDYDLNNLPNFLNKLCDNAIQYIEHLEFNGYELYLDRTREKKCKFINYILNNINKELGMEKVIK